MVAWPEAASVWDPAEGLLEVLGSRNALRGIQDWMREHRGQNKSRNKHKMNHGTGWVNRHEEREAWSRSEGQVAFGSRT